jgi:HSP20 family protein
MKQVRDLNRLQEKINRVFEENLRLIRARVPREKPGVGVWSPPVDIYETEDSVVVKAELPGMKKEEIKIEVKGDVLNLRGERKLAKTDKEDVCHLVERFYGSFSRNFNLPVSVDQSRAKATYKHGVLEVRLPKRGEVKIQPIKVEIKT